MQPLQSSTEATAMFAEAISLINECCNVMKEASNLPNYCLFLQLL